MEWGWWSRGGTGWRCDHAVPYLETDLASTGMSDRVTRIRMCGGARPLVLSLGVVNGR